MNVSHEKYWQRYSGLQRAKHRLLDSYLAGWYPKMSFSGRRKVLYIDSHAGRGRHTTGDEGSPLIALQRLLDHKSRDDMLRSTEFRFVFFEIDANNAKLLEDEIKVLGELPNGMFCEVYAQDYEAVLQDACDAFRREGTRLAPAFIFVDPFGFTLSMDLLNSLLSFPSVEILVNFMYRWVDMAIVGRTPGLENSLDRLFGCTDWRSLRDVTNYLDRSRKTLDLFAQQLHARWVTRMELKARNSSLKYVLFHATNHPAGRRLMKDTMWTVDPYPEGGTFTVRERDVYGQVSLIGAPDLEPLRRWLCTTFQRQEVDYLTIKKALLDTVYREPHLHAMLYELVDKGRIEWDGDGKKPVFKHNPRFRFPSQGKCGE